MSWRCVAEPGDRLVDDQAAGPLVRDVAGGVARHAVAVGLEALDQAEAAVERKGRDERGGREPARAKRSASVGARSRRMPLWRAPWPGG